MIPAEVIKKIKKIHIKSSRMVNTIMAGQYKSIFRGAGIEFEEVREYSPGDDVKSIDWKVSARLGRPFVKLYREERELVVILLLDMSASQQFGTRENLKKETAAEIASVLAFNAIRNNDKVGAILFTDKVEKYIPPKKGSGHVWRVIKEIFTFHPEHKKTDINCAVRYLGNVCRKKTISFLISDFLTDDFSNQIKSVSKKHEMIGVFLSDPGEFLLPRGGILSLKDFETGRRIFLDAYSEKIRHHYEIKRKKAHREKVETLKSLGVDCIEISTTGSVVDALVRYFRYRERRKR